MSRSRNFARPSTSSTRSSPDASTTTSSRCAQPPSRTSPSRNRFLRQQDAHESYLPGSPSPGVHALAGLRCEEGGGDPAHGAARSRPVRREPRAHKHTRTTPTDGPTLHGLARARHGSIGYSEFVEIMTEKISARDPEEELGKAFELFDEVRVVPPPRGAPSDSCPRPCAADRPRARRHVARPPTRSPSRSPQDSTGKISLRNMRRIAKELGENLSDEELQARVPRHSRLAAASALRPFPPSCFACWRAGAPVPTPPPPHRPTPPHGRQ